MDIKDNIIEASLKHLPSDPNDIKENKINIYVGSDFELDQTYTIYTVQFNKMYLSYHKKFVWCLENIIKNTKLPSMP